MTQIKNWILGGLLAVMLASTASAGDYEKGREAYHNRDYATAIIELTPLAEGGDAEAQFLMGLAYSADSLIQDYAETMKWYRLAAEQGHNGARSNLGWMYHNGKGVPRDDAEAIKWYRLAAEAGDDYAQNALGGMYDYGRGVAEDDVRAYMWYSLSALQGNKDAKSDLEYFDNSFFVMSRKEIAQAKEMARQCFKRNYKDC